MLVVFENTAALLFVCTYTIKQGAQQYSLPSVGKIYHS